MELNLDKLVGDIEEHTIGEGTFEIDHIKVGLDSIEEVD